MFIWCDDCISFNLFFCFRLEFGCLVVWLFGFCVNSASANLQLVVVSNQIDDDEPSEKNNVVRSRGPLIGFGFRFRFGFGWDLLYRDLCWFA